MPRFEYRAAQIDGEIVEGQMEAPELAVVIERLQGQGLLPIHAAERKAGAASSWRLQMGLLRQRVGWRERVEFIRSLATMLEANIVLDHSLKVIARVTANPNLAEVIEQMRHAIEGGETFSAALMNHPQLFPSFYGGMVKAGESTGTLALALGRLADYEERSLALRETVRSAMVYPLLLMVVAGLSLMILLVYVVPNFEPLFADMGAAIPFSTQVVIGCARLLQGYWWLLGLGIIGALLGARMLWQGEQSRYALDKLILRAPLVGDLQLKVEIARFSRSLGALLQNRVPILGAMAVVRESISNTVLRANLAAVSNDLEQGRGLAKPLAQGGWFPDLALQFIEVGEESGQLENMLMKLADIYDTEVERAVKRVLAILEPVLILGMGVIIGFIIISILLAILGLNEFAL